MSRLRNISPGEVLLEEFLNPLGITQYRLSKDIGVPQTRISQIPKREQKNFSRHRRQVKRVLRKFC